MTDQELIERAAKAAGAKNYSDKCWPGLCLSEDEAVDPFYVNSVGSGAISWDPLEDDGDAFRLACHLGIDTMHFHAQVAAKSYLPSSMLEAPAAESLTDNRVRCAATRRAIVRAAAGLLA